MLKKLLIVLCLCLSFSAFACWKVEGQVSVDGEDYKIHQKFEHGKEQSFPMGTFIFNMTINSKNKKQTVVYSLSEKKGTAIILITKGSEGIEVGKSKDIYAKGEKDQPHSIITLKLTDI